MITGMLETKMTSHRDSGHPSHPAALGRLRRGGNPHTTSLPRTDNFGHPWTFVQGRSQSIKGASPALRRDPVTVPIHNTLVLRPEPGLCLPLSLCLLFPTCKMGIFQKKLFEAPKRRSASGELLLPLLLPATARERISVLFGCYKLRRSAPTFLRSLLSQRYALGKSR